MFANSSWGNAAMTFSLSPQFHLCVRTCYKLYSGKLCILGDGKRLGGETLGLQYPVSLLRNIRASYIPEANILLRGLPYHGLAPSKHLRCMPGDGRSATFNKVGNS